MSTPDKHDARKILEKINLLFSIFDKDGLGNISEIEKSLLIEQVENLKSAILNIQKTAEPVAVVNTVQNVVETLEANVEDIAEEIVEEKIEEAEQQIEAPVVEVIAKEEPQPVVEEVAKQAVVETQSPKEEPVAEVVEKQEVVEEKVEEPVIETAGKQPKVYNFQLRNMKQIIDLNMSFVLKGDLFKGNIDVYNQFLQEVDKTQDEDEAFELVQQYAEKLNWDKEDKPYALVVRAVEKRFLPMIG